MTRPIPSRRRPATAATILIVTLAFAAPGCKRHRGESAQTQEDAPMSTVIHTADTHAGYQLVSGFYAVEHNAWRWTAGKFSVVLRLPRFAASKGAILQLKFTIPDVAMAQTKTVTLSASLNGVPLTPESYTQAGVFAYRRDIPASMLEGESARVDFAVDKTIPPNETDKRELGVIVSEVGFEPR